MAQLQLQDVMKEFAELKRRLAILEAREAVARFMNEWGAWADRVEGLKNPQDAAHLAHNLMTEDGVCDFSAIPGWQGVWGPEKQDIIDKFINFSQPIGWAYHIYPNVSIDVDLDEGTAHYFTSTEFVPLTIQEQGHFLFLRQDSYLKLVRGEWKMARYQLSNLRQVRVAAERW